jgi:hypothetical protein
VLAMLALARLTSSSGSLMCPSVSVIQSVGVAFVDCVGVKTVSES